MGAKNTTRNRSQWAPRWYLYGGGMLLMTLALSISSLAQDEPPAAADSSVSATSTEDAVADGPAATPASGNTEDVETTNAEHADIERNESAEKTPPTFLGQLVDSVNNIGASFTGVPGALGAAGDLLGDKSKPVSERAQGAMDLLFGSLVGVLASVLFFEVPIVVQGAKVPLILLVLVLGGIFFTFRFGFINIRLFAHSISVIRGKYDRADDAGEISHFQALTSALSATVGLGNIAGVAVAIAAGGAGAIFWMWVIAFFGMSLKFSSCSLAQLYRRIKEDGTVLGGPMVYLDEGIQQRFLSLWPLAKIFGIVFACFTVMAALGGGNMFQGNQMYSIVSTTIVEPLLTSGDMMHVAPFVTWIFGVLLAVLVGAVIIGGIKRIGEVTSKMVPAMCIFYCLCCLVIILTNAADIPAMFASIFSGAFSPEAMFGGMIGVLLTGAKRAAFSNEAGLGSAAIAHAAARTEEPVREGVVAMIGPFIDTIVVCTMTALTILITKTHLDPATLQPVADKEGIELTTDAFATLGSWVPYLLCLAVFVFAYSSMISWSYYGERAVEYLIGNRGILPYRIVYVIFVILGPVLSLQAVVDFSDMMLLSMAFPNIIGMVILSGVLAPKLKDYVDRLKSGQMKPEW